MDKIKQKGKKFIIVDYSQVNDIKVNDYEDKSKNNFNIKENIIIENKRIRKNNIYERKYYKNYFRIKEYILIFKLIIIMINLFQAATFWNITLKIQGIGFSNILGYSSSKKFSSKYYPKEIFINGIIQNKINYSYYFNQTENLVELFWNTIIKNCEYMFYECSNITDINLSNFDTSQVSKMDNMFYGCSSLSSLNLSNFDTSQVTMMDSMFVGCSSLSSLDLSNFNTSQVLSMHYMFSGCSSLSSLNLSNIKTSQVISMHYMFRGCSSLSSLNLSNFDTSQVIWMQLLFSGCLKLEYII